MNQVCWEGFEAKGSEFSLYAAGLEAKTQPNYWERRRPACNERESAKSFLNEHQQVSVPVAGETLGSG
jgi:hypothetical protein